MGKEVTDARGIVLGHGLLVLAIGSRKDERDRGLVQDKVEPVKIRFVGVGGCIGVRIERGGAASTGSQKSVNTYGYYNWNLEPVVGVWDRSGDTDCVLNIQVGLDTGVILVITAIAYTNGSVVGTCSRSEECAEESLRDRMLDVRHETASRGSELTCRSARFANSSR